MSLKILGGILGFVGVASVAFAQTSPTQNITPQTIQDNCLLKESGLIDSCPHYWQEVRSINQGLRNSRSLIEQSGYNALQDFAQKYELEHRFDKLKKNLETPDFLQDYSSYITQQFIDFLRRQKDATSTIVEDFFHQTYYDADQSGLSLSQLELYNKNPQLYDSGLVLLISVRNYTSHTLDQMEDIYCFSTLAGLDYMYPLHVQQGFKANSITNLVVKLDLGISPLLNKFGIKRIACTLVYRQDNNLKYTNRGKLIFDLKEKK